jgi:hypothetical protein
LALCVCLATESACFLSPSIPLPASASGAFLSSPRWSSLGDAAAGVGRDGGKGRILQLSTPMMAAKPGTKALIVGAGPAGILSAHYLLRRGYDVTVAEKRDDPRKARRDLAIANYNYRLHAMLRCNVVCIMPRMKSF